MFACPHCHKAIEVGPSEPMPWYRYDPGNPKVGLGCGTLLAIAIIVSLCSGGVSSRDAIGNLREDVQRLTKQVEELETSIEHVAPKPAAAEAQIP